MALSEFAVRKAKPKEKAYKLADGGGLYLHVQTSGSKHWRMKYRFGGKEKLLTFGPHPLITIAEARKKRDVAKKQLHDGLDPGVEKKISKLAAESEARQTFGLIAEEHIDRLRQEGAADGTITKTEWLLKKLALPLEKRPIKDIRPAEILDLLQQIEKSGRRETARRLRGTISTVFKLAIVTLRAETDPTIPLHGALKAPQVVGRAAITDEKAFGTLLSALDDYDGWPDHQSRNPVSHPDVRASWQGTRRRPIRIRPKPSRLAHSGRAHEDAPAPRCPALPSSTHHPKRRLVVLRGHRDRLPLDPLQVAASVQQRL